MLIEFSVGNYRSFRDLVTLSMEAEPRISERDKAVDARNIAETPEGKLLRVVGIYGANASGKTNLLRAMGTMRDLVLNSAREGQAGDSLPVQPFRLDIDKRDAPSEFEVVFTTDRGQFRYGMAATRKRVEREWLFTWSAGDEVEQLGFERDEDAFRTGPGWERDEAIEQKTRPEALHLSAAAAFNHPQATGLLGWFRRLRLIQNTDGTAEAEASTIELILDKSYRDTILALMSRLDFGIDDLKIVHDPALLALRGKSAAPGLSRELWGEVLERTKRVVAIRSGVEFDLSSDESAGTAKAFELAGPLIKALAHGEAVVIDEFDARLHTLLSKQLVELFQDPKTNPHDAQLVFASHDTNLLTRTLLRRDQLWFVEKSRKSHASDLFSLAELRLEDGKGVRNDARYEADYLQGKYGAIPFFGPLGALLADNLRDED